MSKTKVPETQKEYDALIEHIKQSNLSKVDKTALIVLITDSMEYILASDFDMPDIEIPDIDLNFDDLDNLVDD